MSQSTAPIFVDETHCGRHVTGLERITLELFSAEALAPLPITPVRAPGRKIMMAKQMVGLPGLALANRKSLVLCPGFPPSIPLTLVGGDRVIPYIHDLFLLTRPDDLNRRAKLYMVAPFQAAVRRAPLFLVNSETTATELRRFCRPEAAIQPYRPAVRNIFGVSPGDRAERRDEPGTLRLLALGTVEPRKNLEAAAAILEGLRRTTYPNATLDIVGRSGWGVDEGALAGRPGVTLHGYQPSDAVRRLIDRADALISTSHDEGLGLPLLEAQYAGLPVIAPRRPVFHEVLRESGIIVDPADPVGAAATIGTALSSPGWRAGFTARADANLARWNATAADDKSCVVELLKKRMIELSGR